MQNLKGCEILKKYSTGQREILLSFLRERPDQQFFIEEIYEQLCVSKDISLSTIYRNINKLVQEEEVRRFAKEGSRKFLYQYIGDTNCSEHLHLKCNVCGQIYHIDDESMNAILLSALKNNFMVDKKKSMLYGLCMSCR